MVYSHISPSGDGTLASDGMTSQKLHPLLLELLEFWQSKCQESVLPSRAMFDPFALLPWLGRLILLDVIDRGADFRYRLHGTWLVELFGVDLTGKRLSEVRSPVARLWHEYQTCVRDRRPLCISSKTLSERDHRIIDKVVLPLASDGTVVDRLLIGITLAAQDPGPS